MMNYRFAIKNEPYTCSYDKFASFFMILQMRKEMMNYRFAIKNEPYTCSYDKLPYWGMMKNKCRLNPL